MSDKIDSKELAKATGLPLSWVDEDLLQHRLRALSAPDNIPDAITILTTFSMLARARGLLYLEDLLSNVGDPLLQTLLQLVVDGTDPVLVDEIAQNRINAELSRRSQYLQVIKQGILAVQSGDNPRIVAERLHAISGTNPPDWARQTIVTADSRSGEPLSQEEIDALLTAISSSDVPAGDITDVPATFSQLFLVLSDRDLQQVFRESDEKELALALRSVQDGVQQKVLKNLSKRAAIMLKEDMQFMGPVRLRDVIDAQNRIVNLIHKLEEQGEVVVDATNG